MKLVVLATLVAACGGAPVPVAPDAPGVCATIAADIEGLRARFPALVEFRASTAELARRGMRTVGG